MKDFAAIDLDTANDTRSSVYRIGAIIVRNGKIIEDMFYSLINPFSNNYKDWIT